MPEPLLNITQMSSTATKPLAALVENDWSTVPLFRTAKAHIRVVDTVLDVGAGLRPQSLVTCKQNICIEPHGEYSDALEAWGYRVIRSAAPGAFDQVTKPVDTVALIDVIEHMEKNAGLETVRRACEIARHQVIVFTPLGFMPQSGGDDSDAWGLQGQHWQEHRSGWTPDEFPGWLHFVDESFAPGHAAFVAIWSRG